MGLQSLGGAAVENLQEEKLSVKSSTVFLETVVGGGQHGGGVSFRTRDLNKGRPLLSESVQFSLAWFYFVVCSRQNVSFTSNCFRNVNFMQLHQLPTPV